MSQLSNRYIEIFRSNLGEVRAAMSPKMRGPGGPMGGYNSRPTPYDSRDRFGGMNRYSLGGRGRTRKFLWSWRVFSHIVHVVQWIDNS